MLRLSLVPGNRWSVRDAVVQALCGPRAGLLDAGVGIVGMDSMHLPVTHDVLNSHQSGNSQDWDGTSEFQVLSALVLALPELPVQ